VLANPLVLGLIALLGLIGVTVGLVYLYKWLREDVQGYPNEAEIEGVILPYVAKAIMMAYKASEQLIDAGQERLRGIDKKKLADAAYDMLPNMIYVPVGGNVIPIPIHIVKQLISKERFAGLVQYYFDEFMAWYDRVQDAYAVEISEILGESVAVPSG
jgi:hypothetical protein